VDLYMNNYGITNKIQTYWLDLPL